MKRMLGGMGFRQRDVVLIPFPYSDLTGSKKRPALIISNSKLKGDDKLCCLITSANIKDGVFIGENDFEEGKLPFRSFVKPSRVFSIDSRIIVKKLCRVNEKFYSRVQNEVSKLID